MRVLFWLFTVPSSTGREHNESMKAEGKRSTVQQSGEREREREQDQEDESTRGREKEGKLFGQRSKPDNKEHVWF